MDTLAPLVSQRYTFVLVTGLLFGQVAAAADLGFQSPDGRRAVAAVETRAPITLDGALDEEVWQLAEPAADFIQAEPHEGQPATERTDVRLAFDRDALYIGVICHDATPAGADRQRHPQGLHGRRAGHASR